MLPAGAQGLPSLPTTLTRAAIGWLSSTRTVNFFESAARANPAQATTQVREQTAKALFNGHLRSCGSNGTFNAVVQAAMDICRAERSDGSIPIGQNSLLSRT